MIQKRAQKIGTLDAFASSTNMKRTEYVNLRHHLETKYGGDHGIEWMSTLDTGGNLIDLFADLPVAMRSGMLRKMHSGKHLNIDFFATVESPDFFSFVVPHMHTGMFDENSIIYLTADYAERLYFVVSGCVGFCEGREHAERGSKASAMHLSLDTVHTNKPPDESPYQLVTTKSTIGDYEVLSSKPREDTSVAVMDSETLQLHKRDLLRALAEFPDVMPVIYQQAWEKREERRRRREEKAVVLEAAAAQFESIYLQKGSISLRRALGAHSWRILRAFGAHSARRAYRRAFGA